MIDHPFHVFRPFDTRLRVAMFTKDDDIRSDAEVGRITGAKKTAGLHQVHGANVVVIRKPTDRIIRADGMITDVPGLLLTVRWADCQNFVLFSPSKNVTGIVHAGWRGILAGVIPEFFKVLKKEWGVDGSDVLVGAGPSLCKQCADFTDPLTELPGFPGDLIDACPEPGRRGRSADLQTAALRQLLACGVQGKNIERHAECTRHQPQKYWTYRGGHKDEVRDGHTNMLVCALLPL